MERKLGGLEELVYLSGGMDVSPDYGVSWRRNLEEFVSQFGLKCFNPVEEEEQLLGIPARELQDLRTRDEEQYKQLMRKLIDFELDTIVKRTKFMVVYLDASVRAGTYGEVTVAFQQRIPIYMIVAIPAEDITAWMLGCATRIFYSLDEFKDFIAQRFR